MWHIVAPELSEVDTAPHGDVGVLLELTFRSLTEGLLRSNKPTRECHAPAKRCFVVLDQQNLEFAVLDGQHKDVDGDSKGRRRIVVCVVTHGETQSKGILS